MNTVKVIGNVDENHQLSAEVPSTIPPGPITIWIIPTSQEDEAGDVWTAGVAAQWDDELSDPRQDIYTLADGEPVAES